MSHRLSTRLPIDSVFGMDPNDDVLKIPKSYEKYTEDWTAAMNQAFDIVRKNTYDKGQYNKRYYDKKVRGVDIEVGDRVLRRNSETGGTGKLRNWWEDCVYTDCGGQRSRCSCFHHQT